MKCVHLPPITVCSLDQPVLLCLLHMSHALYYSNYCEFCKEVLGLVARRGIQPLLQLVCVDTVAHSSLPRAVDRVPLVITSHGNVMADDDVVMFIEMLPPPRNAQQPSGSGGPGPAADVGAVSPLLAQGGIEWTTLEECELPNDGAANLTYNFDFIDGTGNFGAKGGIEAFTNMDTQKRLKTDTSALDKLTAERDSDIASIRRNMVQQV